MTPEHRQRAEVVATLRKAKLPIRAIAKAVGVDPHTVRRDLAGKTAVGRWGNSPPLERFWAKVDKSGGPDACWPWTGPIHLRYGACRWAGLSSKRAHRVSLEISLGRPLGPGMFACHHCDNPPCVNPTHLFEGTNADNQADARAKGLTQRGERNPQARLTDEQAREIRDMVGTMPKLAIAKRYGVAESTVWYIAAGRRWVG